MRVKGKNFSRQLRIMILLLCVSFGLSNCTSYNPAMYASYDVLNPGPEVRKNPIGWVVDGKIVNDKGEEIKIEKGIIVNEAFSVWVYELKEEIEKLQK